MEDSKGYKKQPFPFILKTSLKVTALQSLLISKNQWWEVGGTKNQQKKIKFRIKLISLISPFFVWSKTLLNFYKYFNLVYLRFCY